MSSPTPRRRFPPLCWTDDEAQALISVFKDKWSSLGRTNLKANDWDDVAATLAAQFPLVSPSKTAAQCHNKIEKLRKRYRSEKQRASTRPGRFSPWALYRFMEELEGESGKSGFGSGHTARKGEGNSSSRFLADLDEFVDVRSGGGDAGFPVKSLGHRNLAPLFNPKMKLKKNESSGFLRRFGGVDSSGVGVKDLGGGSGLLRSAREVDPVEEMVSSIQLLGEKYMKVEKRKMEMAREIVMMQMDMEMKQTQVIMESQQQIVNACVSALLDSKKKKKRKIKAVSTDS
ncbi:trihelix transcription factor ENAP1-like isoform X1 [Rosa rugosa]|uniref:trihelix transcription factor ENAP1-like isoform X1 n=1 Tax=Rosa rugosa TaxID=74645 RepID=UPI002B41619C|nr:trihelix transcription factor ENAP1-like isoform X1 [Rosa rugosa]XP_062027984.1 trihelix transcription factor ENAP1-like isoform X1 [Rosa rugosa]